MGSPETHPTGPHFLTPVNSAIIARNLTLSPRRSADVMAYPTLSADQIEALKRYNTPTISNAIEVFNVRDRHIGFLPHTIRCLLPELGPDGRIRRHLHHPGRQAHRKK